ncbi:MAG: hypothetical protein RL088_2 [Verrucomicrobiota bacterium]|jgi:hypothetical protein
MPTDPPLRRKWNIIRWLVVLGLLGLEQRVGFARGRKTCVPEGLPDGSRWWSDEGARTTGHWPQCAHAPAGAKEPGGKRAVLAHPPGRIPFHLLIRWFPLLRRSTTG